MRVRKITCDEVIDINRNCDVYFVEVNTGFSTQEFTIYVDFAVDLIYGDCIRYGDWDDIEQSDCIKILELVKRENKVNRNFDNMLQLLTT